MRHRYPAELTQVFMSANLIGGFHNRLEGSRCVSKSFSASV
jgi:elongation factor 1-gamma